VAWKALKTQNDELVRKDLKITLLREEIDRLTNAARMSEVIQGCANSKE